MGKGGKVGTIAIAVTLVIALVLAWRFYPMGAVQRGSGDPRMAPREAPDAMPAGSNAAESYRKAIALLNALCANPALSAQLDRYVEGNFDDDAARFFGDHHEIVSWVQSGATSKHVDWGKRSVEERLSDLNGLRGISMFTLAHARAVRPLPETSTLLDDTLASMALARHVGSDAVLVNKQVEMAIEIKSIDTLAAGLGTLTRDGLSGLPDRLDALPSSITGKQLAKAEAINAQEMVRQQGGGVIIGGMADGLGEFYAEIGEEMDDQSPSQFARTVNAAIGKRPLNSFVKINGPAFARVRETMAIVQAKRAMLRTAIQVKLNGESAAAQSKDPFGDGPFEYTSTADGFELTSKLASRNGAVKLAVGGK